MTKNNKVFSSACDIYDYDSIKKILTSHFDSIISEEYKDFDFSGKLVAIKPNLLAKRSPDAAITTSPVFVRCAAEYFIEKKSEVVICDSPGGLYNATTVGAIYNVCGMTQAAQLSGAVLNNDFGYTEIFNKNAAVSKSFNIINPLAKADFIVNLCRLKTHSLCNMSAAVKNLYGAIPGLQKAEQHARFPKIKDFANYLVDICDTLSPNISVIDAIDAMEGNGPAGGTIKKVGLVLSSSNPYSLDLVALHIMDFKISDVLTSEIAVKRGFCPDSIDKIDIIGQPIESYISHFKRPDSSAGGLIKQLPDILGGRLRKWLEPKPIINKSKCVGCGECVSCCPQKTITLVDKKAVIHYDKCIKCYCCQELCPMKAVEIKQKSFMKL